MGGEGDGGQIGLGLFGAVNVEPAGSRWYRSQVTHETLRTVTRVRGSAHHPYAHIDYEARQDDGTPILAMLDDRRDGRGREIVHGDLNAVIVLDEHRRHPECARTMFGGPCRRIAAIRSAR